LLRSAVNAAKAPLYGPMRTCVSVSALGSGQYVWLIYDAALFPNKQGRWFGAVRHEGRQH
jgi:hypothetical protein